MPVRILSVLYVLLLFQTFVYGQNDKLLQFTDGQERTVVDNFYEEITSIKIMEKEFEATLTSVGKANAIDDKLLEKLQRKNRKIYNQAQKITTSFALTQGNTQFYIRGFHSINIAIFRNGQFKVRCRIYLIEIHSKEHVSYIPILTAIRKI